MSLWHLPMGPFWHLTKPEKTSATKELTLHIHDIKVINQRPDLRMHQFQSQKKKSLKISTIYVF